MWLISKMMVNTLNLNADKGICNYVNSSYLKILVHKFHRPTCSMLSNSSPSTTVIDHMEYVAGCLCNLDIIYATVLYTWGEHCFGNSLQTKSYQVVLYN